MAAWRKPICIVCLFLFYFWNPFYVRSNLVDMVYATLHRAHRGRALNPNSLKAAVTNVTSDFDQFAFLLQDFFDRLPNNTTELLFRDYLKSKSTQSHKDLEYFLDWVLSFYNLSWPFVVVYAILKLSPRDEHGNPVNGEQASKKKKLSVDPSASKRQPSSLQEREADLKHLTVSSIQ